MKDKKYPSGEYKLLEAVKKTLGGCAAPGGRFALTLGDDAAVRRCGRGERQILTADIAVEKVHFTTDIMTFEEIGFRAMAANVSDCAAMAALPEAALVQLVFPEKANNLQKDIIGLYHGFAQACRKWKFKLIGGDLSRGPAWTIGITLLGTAPGRLLTRAGIRAADVLWVSGFPGRSAAGLAAIKRWGRRGVPVRYSGLVTRHIRPEPSVDLAVALGRCKKVHVMMDLSDGISKDARTLCFENRLGLELCVDGVAVPQDMRALSKELGIPWQEWLLHGGEGYELLFAASKNFSPADVQKALGRGLIQMGIFTDRHGDFVVRESGRVKKVPKGSWDHITP
jgi:thiamine-monophosphate kinase